MRFLNKLHAALRHFLLAIFWLRTYEAGAQDNYEIKAFKIEGVRQISSDALREVLATQVGSSFNRILFWRAGPRFSAEEFQRDLRRMIEFYQREGFYQARVEDYKILADDKKEHVRLLVKIAEELPATVSDIKLAGAKPEEIPPQLEALFAALTLHPGARLRQADLRHSQIALASYLTQHGYPFAGATAEVHRDDKTSTASVTFRVNAGPECVFGQVQITGNKKISQRIILEELPFQPEEAFNQRKLLEGQQRIYRLELFQSVSVRGLAPEPRDHHIPIEVRIREAPMQTLKIGGGYGTEERFRATLNFRRRNFLGGARRLETEIKYSDIEPGRLQARIFQPHFFDAKTALILSPFYLRHHEKVLTTRDVIYRLRSFGGELIAQHELALRANAFLRYRLEDVFVQAGRAQPADSTVKIPQSYQKATWSVGLFYNNSLPIFSPARGWFTSLEINYSGPWSEFRPLKIKTGFDYLKTIIESRYYQKAADGLVLAYRLKMATLNLLHEKERGAPLEERFYTGGSASVRGWRRSQLGPHIAGDPVGGQSLLEGSVEARLKIVGLLGAVAFVDFGNVWPRALTYKLNEIRYATGLGLRYDTPIGPIRFDAARKTNRLDESIEDRRWEFYLSVGQAF